ncbi:uncharacterized protein LOC116612487 [Nematostella vectensis]|uniref:uncharacterized protein LOC116612487 n=1 Tax=Nematostella vectensis TaxID=45351 RepID=UPI002077738D|nr:uncharacterized protein LOC116612487 [Nematostella vectensis]
MAAPGRRVLSSWSCILQLTDRSLITRGLFLSSSNNISTSSCDLKKTPHTVGVPAWAKAAQRRWRSLTKLDKPKTKEQIEAEYLLSNNPEKLDFYTSTKNAKPKDTTTDNEPEMVLTKNRKAFVIYHPKKHDPHELLYSKDATITPWWELSADEVKNYRDTLTDEEVSEARKLRSKDPLLWTVNALSRLYKAKPLVVMLAAPLTDEQKEEVEIERKLLQQWSDYKRKYYRANQEVERQNYFEKTRGLEMNRALGLKQ